MPHLRRAFTALGSYRVVILAPPSPSRVTNLFSADDPASSEPSRGGNGSEQSCPRRILMIARQFERISPDPILDEGRPLSRWQKFRTVVKVVELRLRFIALMAATGLVFGYWDTLWNYYDKWTRPAGDDVAAAIRHRVLLPDAPQRCTRRPGQLPDLRYAPFQTDQGSEGSIASEGVTARVQLAPFRIAQAGIRTAEVDYCRVTETVTTVGFVTFDERRLARISSKIKGDGTGREAPRQLHRNVCGSWRTPGRALQPRTLSSNP